MSCFTSILDCFENYTYEHPMSHRVANHNHHHVSQRCGRAYRLMPGDFVERDKGTGFVHCAPAHGKEDFQYARFHGLRIVRSVISHHFIWVVPAKFMIKTLFPSGLWWTRRRSLRQRLVKIWWVCLCKTRAALQVHIFLLLIKTCWAF